MNTPDKNWNIAVKRLRKAVFLNEELSEREDLFKSFFVYEFERQFMKNNKIKSVSSWNIKLSSHIDKMNAELLKGVSILSTDFIKDIFIFISLIRKKDRFTWLAEKVTNIYKDIVFSRDKKEFDNIQILFESKKIKIVLNIRDKNITLIDKIKNQSYIKLFEIKDLDIYPSQRELIQNKF